MLKIELEWGQKLFFTSDTHYNHKNICRGVTAWRTADDKIPIDQAANLHVSQCYTVLVELFYNDPLTPIIQQLVPESDSFSIYSFWDLLFLG